MALNNLKSPTAVMEDLKEQGFAVDFRFDKNKLIPFQYPTRSYTADELTLVEIFRFEGNTDPGDASILYVLETRDGLKGTISNGYGVEANTSLEDFLESVQSRV